MHEEVIILFTVLALVAGGVVIMVLAMFNRRHQREMEHRERLAMIERGLVPAPERDPAGFEAAAGLGSRGAGDRYRSAGVAMIGLGLALMMLIGFAAENGTMAVGIGGAWIMLGAALVINYYLVRRDRSQPSTQHWAPLSPRHPPEPEPPTNVAP